MKETRREKLPNPVGHYDMVLLGGGKTKGLTQEVILPYAT